MAWTEQTGKHAWRVRYPTSDGHIASISGFTTQKAADDHATDIETDQRRQVWIDPTLGRVSVEDWSARWLPTLDIDLRTFGNYDGNLRNHIVPRWGSTSLAELSTLDITGWIKELGAEYAPTTVSSIVKLMSMMLEDAVDEHIIPTNPVRRRRRRGRRAAKRQPEKIWATPEEVIRIAAQASALVSDTIGTLIITAAWTGCRWGELAGLHRDNLHLDTGRLIVDPDVGALHEYSRMRWIGPPKTTASARSISLPPFLITLLHQHLERHDNEFVFTNSRGNWLWHSDTTRRGLRPATDGNFDLASPRIRTYPIRPGLTFHGTRHSHKTWMIDDGIPEIAQALRLGHVMPDKVQETYSHVAAAVEARLLQRLQERWDKAVINTPVDVDSTWRLAA